jgi:hypothetical protein
MSEYTEQVLSSDRIRECAQVIRDYQVRIGSSRFEWADITDPLAEILTHLADAGEELDEAGHIEDLDAPQSRSLLALLEAIEAAVRHT